MKAQKTVMVLYTFKCLLCSQCLKKIHEHWNLLLQFKPFTLSKLSHLVTFYAGNMAPQQHTSEGSVELKEKHRKVVNHTRKTFCLFIWNSSYNITGKLNVQTS